MATLTPHARLRLSDWLARTLRPSLSGNIVALHSFVCLLASEAEREADYGDGFPVRVFCLPRDSRIGKSESYTLRASDFKVSA